MASATGLGAVQLFTYCSRSLPLNFFAVASRLQDLSVGCFTGVADGAAGGSAASWSGVAACTEAPCLQVNYRYRHRITHDEFDQLVDDLRADRLGDEIPPHGTLARVRQSIPVARAAGPASPRRRKPKRFMSETV